MSVLGLIGNIAQLAISGTTGLGSLLSGLAQTGYSMYADNRDYEAAQADAAWERQMQEQLRQDGLAQQAYESQSAERQYQDALAQQRFDNDITSQKLALAQEEWAFKRSQAQQEAAAASMRAASRSSGTKGTGSRSQSAGKSSGSQSTVLPTAGSDMDYTDFARTMRERGYTISEIKEMFDVMRQNR